MFFGSTAICMGQRTFFPLHSPTTNHAAIKNARLTLTTRWLICTRNILRWSMRPLLPQFVNLSSSTKRFVSKFSTSQARSKALWHPTEAGNAFYRKRLYRKYSIAFWSREKGFFFDKFGVLRKVGLKTLFHVWYTPKRWWIELFWIGGLETSLPVGQNSSLLVVAWNFFVGSMSIFFSTVPIKTFFPL